MRSSSNDSRPASKRWSVVRAALLGLTLLPLAACGQAAPPATKTTATPADTPVLESGIEGRLQDEAGQPLVAAQVLACMSTVCYSGLTDRTGRFTFSIDPPADVVIKTAEDLSATWRRAAAMMPVRFTEHRLVDVGTVRTAALPEGRMIGPARSDPQTLHAGDGLELTIRRAALTPPVGEALVDVAARRVPSANVPLYPALAGEDVLAVYALHPFTARSRVPIAVRAASTLAAGTRVRFRTISEIDGRFSEPAPGRASGTFVSTDPSAGISELTHLVISRVSP